MTSIFRFLIHATVFSALRTPLLSLVKINRLTNYEKFIIISERICHNLWKSVMSPSIHDVTIMYMNAKVRNVFVCIGASSKRRAAVFFNQKNNDLLCCVINNVPVLYFLARL